MSGVETGTVTLLSFLPSPPPPLGFWGGQRSEEEEVKILIRTENTICQ